MPKNESLKKHPENLPPLQQYVISTIAGLAEVIAFHPVDTATKRYMTYAGKSIFSTNKSLAANFSHAFWLATHDPKTKTFSLYPGLFPYALLYKTGQRTYKFGTQPLIATYLEKNDTLPPFWAHVLSGAGVGAGEALIFLPLDVLKIRQQTGSHDLNCFSHIHRFKDVQCLYTGLVVTIFRNIGGSSVLFGSKKVLENPDDTPLQKTMKNSASSILSLIFSHSPDVVKSIIQKDKKQGSALKVGYKLLTENPAALARGLTFKLATQTPKLTFFLTAEDILKKSILGENYTEKTQSTLKK